MPQFAEYEQARAWLSNHPQVRAVDLLLPDLMGIPRGKRVTVAELEGVHRNGLLLPGVDVRARRARRHGAGDRARLRRGRRRSRLPAGPGSLATVPWLGDEVAQMQVAMYEHDRTPFYGDPRHVLARVLARLPANWGCDRSWRSNSSSTSSIASARRTAMPSRRASRSPAGASTRRRSTRWRNSTSTRRCSRRSMRRRAEQELPTGTVLAEYGPGQFEVNLHHVDDALLACDHAIRLKRLVKGVALQHGMEATFMAEALPRTRGQRRAPARQPGGRRRPQRLRRRRPGRQPRAAARHRRPRGDDQRRDGGLRADREFLPAIPARGLRAAEPELVGQQPRRRVPRAARPAGEPPGRAPRRRRRRESLPARGSGAGGHAPRPRWASSTRARCSPAMPTATPRRRSRSAGRKRSPPSSAARSRATTSASASRSLYAQTRRGEMQDFSSYVSAARVCLVPDDELSHGPRALVLRGIRARRAAARAARVATSSADVCVVGGGIAGCSTALNLAERGYQVVLLEGRRVGWGASGRSGGQAIFGFAAGQDKLVAQVGRDDGAAHVRHLGRGARRAEGHASHATRSTATCNLGQMHAAIKPRHEIGTQGLARGTRARLRIHLAHAGSTGARSARCSRPSATSAACTTRAAATCIRSTTRSASRARAEAAGVADLRGQPGRRDSSTATWQW